MNAAEERAALNEEIDQWRIWAAIERPTDERVEQLRFRPDDATDDDVAGLVREVRNARRAFARAHLPCEHIKRPVPDDGRTICVVCCSRAFIV